MNTETILIFCDLVELKNFSRTAEKHRISQSAVSQHLAILRREKIVRPRKHAQSVSYSLAGDEAPKIMATLHDVFCGEAKALK